MCRWKPQGAQILKKGGEAILIFEKISNIRVFRVSKANITDFLENEYGSPLFYSRFELPATSTYTCISLKKINDFEFSRISENHFFIS